MDKRPMVPMADPYEVLAHGSEEDKAGVEMMLSAIVKEGMAETREEAMLVYQRVVKFWEDDRPVDGSTRHG